MSAKRTATSDLNADNWNQEEEPEEAGTFVKAPANVIEKRVIRTAKRRVIASGNDDDARNNAFGTFSGFKTQPDATKSSLFSFLAASKPNIAESSNTKPPNGSPQIKENGIGFSNITSSASTTPISSKKEVSTVSPGTQNKDASVLSPKRSVEYYAKLKGLNQSVAEWIKKHVDSNPLCILTPIFNDYTKYLKEIEEKHGSPIAASSKNSINDKSSHEKLNYQEPKKEVTNSEKKEQKNTIFGGSTVKPVEQTKESSVFGHTTSIATSKSIFAPSTVSKAAENSNAFKPSGETNPFLTKSANTSEDSKSEEKSSGVFSQTSTISSTFSFGQQSTGSSSSAGFSFGGGKPFTFGSQVSQSESENKNDEQKEEEDEEPPKPEIKQITEEGSVFEQRCKLFFKKDGGFSDRGVGTLFLKPAPNDKIQLIVRATNSLGNLLLNTLLTESMPIKRMNPTNIMIVCLPMPDSEPPPTPVLMRVKTSEEADKLIETLNKHKK